jgi:uncharacterized membrane protein YqhA
MCLVTGDSGNEVRTPQRVFERILAVSRLLVLIPVIFLVLDAAASFVYGADILVRTLTEVIGEPAHVGARLGRFLVVMDTFLVGVTLMILAFGFYELFVPTREREGQKFWLPAWLEMHDLEDLKARVVSMLILVAAITFVDRLVESQNQQEILFLGVGVSIIIVALTAFLWFGRSRPPGGKARAVPATAAGPADDGDGATTALSGGDEPEPRAVNVKEAVPTGGDGVTAILGSASREGRWRAAADMVVTAIAGLARLDLRDADLSELPGREIKVRVVAGVGAVRIIIPPEMDVAESGMTVLGIRSICGSGNRSADPNAPVLALSDRCVLGVVRVRRKARE